MTDPDPPRRDQALTLRHIDRAGFAPYGTLVEMGSPAVAVNDGTALRRDVDAYLGLDPAPNARLITSIYDAEARGVPMVLRVLERHPKTAQLIMPIGGEGHAIVVCSSAADGTPDPATLAAFRCSARQGVIYRRGLWHHPIAPLGTAAQFLVQSWQDATEADCEIVPIAALVVVDEASSPARRFP